MKKRESPLIIAVAGKGGVGKTVITTLMAKVIAQNYNYKLLLIDADPTYPHLSRMVKLIPEKSLETIRAEMIDKTLSQDNSITELAESIDFQVYDSIVESKDFSLFSIGQPEGPGCFCPSNAIVRKVIESISKDFDIVLIDCEAGLEQINRMVIQSVDILLIVTDISLRSIKTADFIRKSALNFTNFKKLGVIINRVSGNIGPIRDELEALNLPIIAEVLEDNMLHKYDLEGKALIDLTEDNSSVLEVKKLVNKIL